MSDISEGSPDVENHLLHTHAHNLFLQVGLDVGVLGLMAFVALILYSLVQAWRASQSGPARALGVGLVATFVTIITHGMLDTIFWGAKPSLLLWVSLGLAVALTPLIGTDSRKSTI